jgi:hypothetical protein
MANDNYSFRSGLLLDLLCSEEIFQKVYDWMRLHQMQTIDFASFLSMYSNFCGISELSRANLHGCTELYFVPTRKGVWKKVLPFRFSYIFHETVFNLRRLMSAWHSKLRRQHNLLHQGLQGSNRCFK